MKNSITVNEASIVDLKAELFRKEEEFKKKQFKQGHASVDVTGQSTGRSRTLEKIAALTGKKRKSTKTKSCDEVPVPSCDVEDNIEYEKVKACLEAKAKLYQKMASGQLEDEEDENGESRYLVDFEKKASNQIQVTSEDEEERLKDEDIPTPSSPQDEWVEFVDSFGRDRKCLRGDLEKFKAADCGIKVKERCPSPKTLMTEDMRREMMRQKWEKEQEEMMNNPDTGVHYQNIQFDEVRDHGVGYFHFSKTESERQTQMKLLEKLREQTIEQRNRHAKVKEKRQAALDARLAKIRQRKLQKQGIAHIDAEHPNSKEESSKIDISQQSESMNHHNNNTNNTDEVQLEVEVQLAETQNEVGLAETQNENVERLIAESRLEVAAEKESSEHLRKEETRFDHFQAKRPKQDASMGTQSWLDKQRNDRDAEFAPPAFYYNSRKLNRQFDKT